MSFIQRLGLRGLLSFPPNIEPITLQPLNVLIGPNGSEKTNLIEALELLRATPTDFAAAIRAGGGVAEWKWKGEIGAVAEEDPLEENAKLIEIKEFWGSDHPATFPGIGVDGLGLKERPLRYRIAFTSSNDRMEIVDESVEEEWPKSGSGEWLVHHNFNKVQPFIMEWDEKLDAPITRRDIPRKSLTSDQSILQQRRAPDNYPLLAWLSREFGGIRTFRDWMFGARSPVRAPQRADDPPDELLPDARSLALVLNEIQHRGGRRFEMEMKHFLPRYERVSTRIVGATVQLYLHERGLATPVSAARVSDGTLRFMAMLAALLAPAPPSLLCLEEPELGLHPDAVSLLAELLIDASSRTSSW